MNVKISRILMLYENPVFCSFYTKFHSFPDGRGSYQGKNSDLFEAVSAGSDPRGVHPLTVLVMDGIGIEIS